MVEEKKKRYLFLRTISIRLTESSQAEVLTCMRGHIYELFPSVVARYLKQGAYLGKIVEQPDLDPIEPKVFKLNAENTTINIDTENKVEDSIDKIDTENKNSNIQNKENKQKAFRK